MQSVPMTSVGEMIKAIKKAKAEKLAREAALKDQEYKEYEKIVEETKKDILKNLPGGKNAELTASIEVTDEAMQRKKLELEKIELERKKQQEIDDQIKD
jgi:hypothetical protein